MAGTSRHGSRTVGPRCARPAFRDDEEEGAGLAVGAGRIALPDERKRWRLVRRLCSFVILGRSRPKAVAETRDPGLNGAAAWRGGRGLPGGAGARSSGGQAWMVGSSPTMTRGRATPVAGVGPWQRPQALHEDTDDLSPMAQTRACFREASRMAGTFRHGSRTVGPRCARPAFRDDEGEGRGRKVRGGFVGCSRCRVAGTRRPARSPYCPPLASSDRLRTLSAPSMSVRRVGYSVEKQASQNCGCSGLRPGSPTAR